MFPFVNWYTAPDGNYVPYFAHNSAQPTDKANPGGCRITMTETSWPGTTVASAIMSAIGLCGLSWWHKKMTVVAYLPGKIECVSIRIQERIPKRIFRAVHDITAKIGRPF